MIDFFTFLGFLAMVFLTIMVIGAAFLALYFIADWVDGRRY